MVLTTVQIRNVFAILMIVSLTIAAFAQPEPGDVFKEYTWSCAVEGNPGCNCGGGTFRVGYKNGAQNPTNPVQFAKEVDIANATKAEVILEVSRCHIGTRDLQISVNGGGWIDVPLPFDTYESYSGYYFPVVPVPIGQIKEGTNTVSLKVASSGGSPWPQLLYSGAHLRVYYNPDSKAHIGGTITSPSSGDVIGAPAQIVCKPDAGSVERVEFLGHYRGVNWESDGVYTQWHHVYYHGTLSRHIGTDSTADAATFSVGWDTEWIANQPNGIKLAARIVGSDGTICMTPAVTVGICRAGYDVEVCEITECPTGWVTRGGTKSSKFTVGGDVSKIIGAQVTTVTWGDYNPEGKINGVSIGKLGGGGYTWDFDVVDVDESTAKSALKAGENTMTVAGGGHHGAEIMYPGPMPVVKFSASNDCANAIVNAKEAVRRIRANESLRVEHLRNTLSFIVLSDKPGMVSLVGLNGVEYAAGNIAPKSRYSINTAKLAGGVYLLKIRQGAAEAVRKVSVTR
jgi:hypothetical protein